MTKTNSGKRKSKTNHEIFNKFVPVIFMICFLFFIGWIAAFLSETSSRDRENSSSTISEYNANRPPLRKLQTEIDSNTLATSVLYDKLNAVQTENPDGNAVEVKRDINKILKQSDCLDAEYRRIEVKPNATEEDAGQAVNRCGSYAR